MVVELVERGAGGGFAPAAHYSTLISLIFEITRLVSPETKMRRACNSIRTDVSAYRG